jgi:ABC-2 type transport system permease protein
MTSSPLVDAIAGLRRVFKPSNRSLIRELVTSDFKLRYQGSVLGYLWSLLRPLFLFGVLYLVFTHVIRLGHNVPHYPAYLLLGLVLWQFFIESTVSGMNAITGRGDLVRKVSIPKYTIVLSTTISAFVTLCLNMVVVFIFMLIGHVAVRPVIILALPLLAELVIFCLGIAFILATLFVRFKDISHIWDVILQALFYATPIIYDFRIVPHKLAKIVSLNPLTQIFQDIRSVIITPATLTTKQVFDSQLGRILPALSTVVILALGAYYFRKRSKYFAEEL